MIYTVNNGKHFDKKQQQFHGTLETDLLGACTLDCFDSTCLKSFGQDEN